MSCRDRAGVGREPSFLHREKAAELAYRHTPGDIPGVLFLGGFGSDMCGIKAQTLSDLCCRHGWQFTRFDYTGHGASGGRFEEATIDHWVADAVAILTRVTSGPQVVVGSSLGGWLMVHVAAQVPGRVAALLGIAAAPDFTEELLWPRIPEPERRALRAGETLLLPNPYLEEPLPIRLGLIEDGRRHRVLNRRITVDCPVRLLHGLEDPDVPWQYSTRLAETIACDDLQVVLLKGGDHRLSSPESLAVLCRMVEDLVDQVRREDP